MPHMVASTKLLLVCKAQTLPLRLVSGCELHPDDGRRTCIPLSPPSLSRSPQQQQVGWGKPPAPPPPPLHPLPKRRTSPPCASIHSQRPCSHLFSPVRSAITPFSVAHSAPALSRLHTRRHRQPPTNHDRLVTQRSYRCVSASACR